jgi:hypothetical protein
LLEEKVTLYALKIAEHEKNALSLKTECQAMKKEIKLANEYKTKYER